MNPQKIPSLMLVLVTLSCGSFTTRQESLRPTPGQVFADQFAPHLARIMANAPLPGVGIAVIKDGHLIRTWGAGDRDLEMKLPVTPETKFAIGSTTKAFVASALMQEVRNGRLDLDQPVVEILDDFQLMDQETTQRITTRDLLTHQSGLPRHDAVWYSQGVTTQELMARLRYLEPTLKLREGFQYNNLMYMVAGEVLAKVSGQPWTRKIQRDIVGPLGMEATSYSIEQVQMDSDMAKGYSYLPSTGAYDLLPYRNIDHVGAAGSINSTLNDMAQWVLFNLRKDRDDILDSSNLEEIHSAQQDYAISWIMGEAHYGLGWAITDHRGYRVVEHSGGIDGFNTQIAMVPAERAAVVMFTNNDQGTIGLMSLAKIALDLLLGLEVQDWENEFEAALTAPAREQPGKADYPDDWVELSGPYVHPAYGTLQVDVEDDQAIRLTLGSETMTLDYREDGLFHTTPGPDDGAFATPFHAKIVREASGVTGIEVNFETTLWKMQQKRIHFRKS